MNFSDITNWTIPEGTVTQITDSLDRVIWRQPQPVSADYFYVQDLSGSDNTLTIKKSSNSAPALEIYASTDKENWSSMGTTSTSGVTATIPANGKLYLKCTANAWSTTGSSDRISASSNFAVGGYITSLLDGDGDFAHTDLAQKDTYTFYCLFFGATYLVDASQLVLPDSTQTRCYYNMFRNCSSLTTAPALPATTLADYCYLYMFYGCTALTTAPALPATTLNNGCYSGMFSNCTSLTTTPALPATTLASNCYDSMFRNCTSLTTALVLPATTLATECYRYMFEGCSSLTTAPALPATTLAVRCYQFMFSYCTSLTTAPALPATTLVNDCYRNMFYYCTSLTTAPALPATTLVDWCYSNMFYGCTALTKVTTYATDISAYDCLNSWLYNVSATGDFYNLGGATYSIEDPSGIPLGWTEHTTL